MWVSEEEKEIGDQRNKMIRTSQEDKTVGMLLERRRDVVFDANVMEEAVTEIDGHVRCNA
jgi:hypothetical protein